jgi:hypothetical protein
MALDATMIFSASVKAWSSLALARVRSCASAGGDPPPPWSPGILPLAACCRNTVAARFSRRAKRLSRSGSHKNHCASIIGASREYSSVMANFVRLESHRELTVRCHQRRPCTSTHGCLISYPGLRRLGRAQLLLRRRLHSVQDPCGGIGMK